MATVNGKALLGGIGIEVPQGSQVEIVERIDDGLGSFKVILLTEKGPITGTITTNLLDFTKAEIKAHDLPIDANKLPLYRNLRVKYIGQSNAAVSNGDFLFIQELWYGDDVMECRCVHHGNSLPSTDGKVVVRRSLLERA